MPGPVGTGRMSGTSGNIWNQSTRTLVKLRSPRFIGASLAELTNKGLSSFYEPQVASVESPVENTMPRNANAF
jgi:hypothetical protein